MFKRKFFNAKSGKYQLPIFFPDATRGVVRAVDSIDIKNSKTLGVLVNTYHLYRELGKTVIDKFEGIGKFMNWDGPIISDSGGFQVLTLAKQSANKGSVTDEGVTFKPQGSKKILLTPEKSIRFQMKLKTDLVVVLDDFTPPNVSYENAKVTVERTQLWAKRCKTEFMKICDNEGLSKNKRPYLIGVVQGGEFLDLRRESVKGLLDIGFDGLGFGGWPLTSENIFNYEVAQLIAENTPPGYFLYGLGIGKPHEIVNLVGMGYSIFDCVLPTRDARHKRLYVFNFDSIDAIDVHKSDFYSYFVPDKQKYYSDKDPVSKACDCLLCSNYSRAYLAHLFRIKDITAMRLATIHNLRFYSLLMEKLKK